MANVPQRKREKVELPESGVEAFAQSLKISERAEVFAVEDVSKRSIFVLSRFVVDASGAPVWSEDDWDTFGGWESDRVEQMLRTVYRLSGLLAEDAEKKPETPS